MKVEVSLLIDNNVLSKAKDLGLNLSKVSENALIIIIGLLEQSGTNKQSFSVKPLEDKMFMADRVGFEPTTSSLEGWLAIRAATSVPVHQ